MTIEVRMTFQDKEEMVAFFADKQTTPVEEAKESKAKEVKQSKAKQSTKKEKSPEKVTEDLIAGIKEYILKDRIPNMRKVLPLMPEGLKDINKLDMEQAQSICMELGINV